MEINNQRPSDNYEDRGRGAGGGGGVGAAAIFGLFRLLGLRGMLILAVVVGGIYLFNPFGLRDAIFGQGGGGVAGQSQSEGGSTCAANAQACDFSRRVLGSTEQVWAEQFQAGRLPNYGTQVSGYTDPTIVFFSSGVQTGCGAATSDVGPFYCPQDGKLYIDPSFYQVMQDRLHAPGDFAQAYVIAHEVGHHVQQLIGATQQHISGESDNQTSVRTELQADCFAGVWGHTAQASLQIDDADLREALNAAHSIGDDTLGAQEAQYTHGTSAQRMSWFRRGFDSGDARQCDTWAVPSYDQL